MRYEYMHAVEVSKAAGSAPSKVCLGTMARQFGLCLVHCMASGCVMIPNLAVIESIADALQRPANGGECAEDASCPVTLGVHLYSLDETSRAGAGDTDDHVDTEKEVESAKEKVQVVI